MKFIKNQKEIDDLKDKMKENYNHLMAAYKYYASLSLNYNFPVINQMGFHEFVSQTNIMQKKLMNFVDLDLAFISSHVLPRGNEF